MSASTAALIRVSAPRAPMPRIIRSSGDPNRTRDVRHKRNGVEDLESAGMTVAGVTEDRVVRGPACPQRAGCTELRGGCWSLRWTDGEPRRSARLRLRQHPLG